MKKILLLILLFVSVAAFATDIKIKIKKQYINFPVSQQVDRKAMTFILDGQEECTSVIRLAENPEYWVFQDVSLWKGKTLVISGDFSDEAMQKIYQADTIMGESEIYHEQLRPQYHFTTRRGWINDPNGCCYLNGKWHLFYQHNPYEKEWENMHWGHAVSTDMLHWHELPLALHPDNIGTMFSGTIAIPAGTSKMVAFYTANSSEKQVQCMAESTDEGLNWNKYEGNPVVDSHDRWQSHDTRDPKVFWYAPGKHWVMVVNERTGNTIYNSDDMKTWTPMSHIEGFWECPELFELPVVGKPEEKHWIMWGASGTYMIGQFDGKTFTPESSKQCNLNGSAYACQTFANVPAEDGRVIKMAWGRINFDGCPFNGVMLLPQEQTLHQTANGLRLYSAPVKETETLFTRVFEAMNLNTHEANKALEKFKDNDVLRIKATLHLTYATDAGISYRGQRLLNYDLNGNRLQGEFYQTEKPGSMDITADIYVDRGMVEVYIDGGAFSYSMKRDGREDKGYEIWGNQVQVKNIEVFTANPIWQ